MTKARLGFGLAAAAVVAAAIALFALNSGESNFDASTFAAPTVNPSSNAGGSATETTNTNPQSVAADPTAAPSVGPEPESSETFRVDSNGNLKLDEQTRLGIESLVALTEADKVPAALSELTKTLPPSAARRAEELVDRFTHYMQAQKQSYPGNAAPLTEDDALVQLDGLHALRAAHFGPEVAQAFYGDEEKLSRELIELMRHEKDEGLMLWEKAEKAQKLRDELPTVAAIEKKNRDQAAAAAMENEAKANR